MKKFYTILFPIFFLFATQQTYAQGFDAALLLGLNAAQLDGDGLVGYHKVGLSGGLRVSYPIKEKSDLGLELLYSQRGSRSPLSVSGDLVIVTGLDYLEIPLFYNYKDWYIEDGDYYRVRAEGGLSFGYLFRTSSNNTTIEDRIDSFNRQDLSVHLGLGYSLNKRITLTGRWTSSLVDIYKSDTLFNVDGIRSYYLTFRLEYNL